MKLVFDIEANGFLDSVTTMHCLVAIDVDTGDEYIYKPGEMGWVELFAKATILIGHNSIRYDIPVLKKLFQWTPSCKLMDTMLISQLNKFTRPGGHSLKNLGKLLGENQKIDYTGGFEEYSEDMLTYCVQDVRTNVDLYKALSKEAGGINKRTDNVYKKALKLEHDFAEVSARMQEDGWLIDIEGTNKLKNEINIEMAAIELEIEPMLKDRVIMIDQEPREVKLLKDGRMDLVSRSYFGYDKPKKSTPMTYQRKKTMESDLGNNDQVIALLYQEGWIPTEFNWKVIERQFIKGKPKLTEDSFESINGDLGKQVARWRMLRSRRGLLAGMLDNEAQGRLHCDQFTLGTHSSRARHKIIVNIPSAYAQYGEPIRKLFISDPGTSIIGADSSANQLRGLAHYLNDPEFTHSAVDGSQENGDDVHTRNANILGISRKDAKPFFYALIFGAGARKLGVVVGQDMKEGKRLKELFFKGMPSYQALINRLSNEWRSNGGFIYGVDGRRIFCEQHKALNNLLQAFEATTCRSAYVMICKQLEHYNIDYKVLLTYHDEIEFQVSDKDSLQAKRIALKAFIDAPKDFGIDIMAGDARIGKDWFSVH